MNKLIESMLNKRCIISGDNLSDLGGGIIGIPKTLEDNWLEVLKENNTTVIINTLFISTIVEYPDKKKKEKLK